MHSVTGTVERIKRDPGQQFTTALFTNCDSLQVLEGCYKVSLELLFSRTSSPNSLSLSSQEGCSIPLIISVVFLWTCFKKYMYSYTYFKYNVIHILGVITSKFIVYSFGSHVVQHVTQKLSASIY